MFNWIISDALQYLELFNFIDYCELNYHDQKIRRTPTHDIREHWTAVSTLLDLISSVYRNLHQRP